MRKQRVFYKKEKRKERAHAIKIGKSKVKDQIS